MQQSQPPPCESSVATERYRSRSSGRRVIAVLFDYMTLMAGSYESEVRNAFDRIARNLDLDLYLVYGHGLDEPDANATAHNSIYELLSPENVDGIVSLTSSIGTFCGPERLASYMARYGSMPLCSLGAELPGIPSVVVDHVAAMEEIVEHVIREHGRRRLVHISGTPGHPDAEVRLMAYRNVLARHAIPYDESLVVNGNFVLGAARDAMVKLLERQVVFDAVIAANDSMALAAIDVLRERGIRVPRSVAVTGFDDIVMARLGSPPMTTVAQPFAAMAEQAVSLLLAQMNGHEFPAIVTLPARAVIRHSCGCATRSRSRSSNSLGHSGAAASDLLQQNRAWIHRALTGALGVADGDGRRDAAELVEAVQRTLEGEADAFLETLETILDRVGDEPELCHLLQKGITCLREQLCPCGSVELEDLWHDARELVTLYNTRGQVRRRNEIDASYASMLGFGESLSSALELDALRVQLAKSLPATGARTAWISVFPDGAPDELESLVSLMDGTVVDVGVSRFPANQLLPAQERIREESRTLLVFPMVCETQNFGVAVFDYAAGNHGYQMLRDQISTALRTVSLHHEVVQTAMLHDRSLQERAATAKRMQALSVLAGGVAHDLNNALGPLVGLPNVMLSELNQLNVTAESTTELRTDLEAIRTATTRASQTIKDLLTLSRQGRTAKETMDLNCAVMDSMGGDALRALREAHRQVRIACEPSNESLFVCGSEAHIGRAVTNLVRNAVEAVAGTGEVRVTTMALRLVSAVTGYERVEPGDYAVVAVSDSGVGIPPEEIGWIFEPFATRKRVGDSSGSGLGLAIVHGVVKEHEGYIDVTSKPGGGTTFTLYFPRKEGTLQSSLRSETLLRGSARILVVDDELLQLRTARRILTHLGYDVDTVGCSADALARLDEVIGRSGSYDLILIDMMLNEEMSGLHVFREIRKRIPGQRAILVSGHAPTELAELSLPDGLSWLGKPYSAEALSQAIGQALLQVSGAVSQRPSFRVDG